MSYFNAEQEDYVRDLATVAPEKKCWCAWYLLGECPHCPPGKTLADRLMVACSECRSYPPATDPTRPIVHRLGCPAGEGGGNG